MSQLQLPIRHHSHVGTYHELGMVERAWALPHADAIGQQRPDMRTGRPIDQQVIALLWNDEVDGHATHRGQG